MKELQDLKDLTIHDVQPISDESPASPRFSIAAPDASKPSRCFAFMTNDRLRVGRGTAKAEDAQGTHTQSHTSPNKLVYENHHASLAVTATDQTRLALSSRDAVAYRKVDVRLPGKGNSNPHGARPVHLIITMIKWFRTSRLSITNSLSASAAQDCQFPGLACPRHVPHDLCRNHTIPHRAMSTRRGQSDPQHAHGHRACLCRELRLLSQRHAVQIDRSVGRCRPLRRRRLTLQLLRERLPGCLFRRRSC